MIYVADAGSGGDTVAPDDLGKTGLTGRIVKVDPATGKVTVVADHLPSNAGGEGDSVGPADVAFMGNTLYYIQTHAGAAYGFPATTPTGLYKVNGDGTVTLVANYGAFADANPSKSVSSGSAKDLEPGGNPYSMTVRDGNFYVVDGNRNAVVKITPAGAISYFAQMDTDITTTGITYSGDGPFYVSTLGPFPFSAADGRIYRVGYPTGTITQVASGISSLTDVEFGPGGQLYAVNFMDQATDPNSPLPWTPFTGKLMKVDPATGTFTPIVSGFVATTFVVFNGNTAYVTNNSVPALAPGEIWQIDNVSSLPAIQPTPTAVPTQAPPPAPTATPQGGVIGAPNTGDGSAAGAGSAPGIVVMLAVFAAGLALLGGGVAVSRKRG
jgi:sugar lactone lactonase YvrE